MRNDGAALLQHRDDISTISDPGPWVFPGGHLKWGETPHAFVVLKAGAAATEAELKEFARENMAHFKVPDGFTILNELPKTATGKIQKYLLRRGRAAISRQ